VVQRVLYKGFQIQSW